MVVVHGPRVELVEEGMQRKLGLPGGVVDQVAHGERANLQEERHQPVRRVPRGRQHARRRHAPVDRRAHGSVENHVRADDRAPAVVPRKAVGEVEVRLDGTEAAAVLEGPVRVFGPVANGGLDERAGGFGRLVVDDAEIASVGRAVARSF